MGLSIRKGYWEGIGTHITGSIQGSRTGSYVLYCDNIEFDFGRLTGLDGNSERCPASVVWSGTSC